MPLYVVTHGPLNKNEPVQAILSDAWREHNATYNAMRVFDIESNSRLWVYEHTQQVERHEYVVGSTLTTW